MRRRDLRTACIIIVLAFVSGLSTSGFDFLTNQYVFYRFSEDAHLPYRVNGHVADCGQSENNSDPHKHARDEVQAETARLLALSTMISLVFGVVASMVAGAISDRYGRSLTIGLILLGQALRFITITFLVLLHLPVTVLLLLSATFAGLIGGGWIAFLVQVNVSFTDITRVSDSMEDGLDSPVNDAHRNVQERRRLVLLGSFDATITLAAAIGTAVIGSSIEHFGFVPSALGLLTTFSTTVILIRGVPETKRAPISVVDLPVNETSLLLPTHSGESCKTRALQDSWIEKLSGTWKMIRTQPLATTLVLVAIFIFSLANFTESQYAFLYLMSAPFCWSPENVGLYNGLNSLMLAIAVMLLILTTAWAMQVNHPVAVLDPGPIEPTTAVLMSGSSEELVASSPHSNRLHRLVQRRVLLSRLRMLGYVCVGFFMTITSKLIMGFAFQLQPPLCNRAIFIALFVGLLRAAVIPTLKAFLSSLHSADAQGRLFSLIGCCEYLGLIFGQPSLPMVYASTVAVFPGAVFLLSAGLLGIALLLFAILLHSILRELGSIESVSELSISLPN